MLSYRIGANRSENVSFDDNIVIDHRRDRTDYALSEIELAAVCSHYASLYEWIDLVKLYLTAVHDLPVCVCVHWSIKCVWMKKKRIAYIDGYYNVMYAVDYVLVRWPRTGYSKHVTTSACLSRHALEPDLRCGWDSLSQHRLCTGFQV